ncbi:hypothetical protein HELRODRAFT_68094, partial [Helobdella robusta]|uniref:Neurotransmitter-gated ion-channel transmembrane domain-containing protein n=1 Tax=Helobdella robusta TaxID=6412 RepID=T1FZA1_HELRO
QDYSVSMYLRQCWQDKRLKFNPRSYHMNEVSSGKLSRTSIWVPDIFFRNEKRATFHEVTVKNRFLKLNFTGFVWYVTKISATFSCPMKLYKYPFDTQICPMTFESFGYPTDILFFSWLDEPVTFDKQIELPQFIYRTHVLHDCVQNYTGGIFSCLEIKFILRRDVGYFLIQVYVPSTLIVILSWISFWLNIDASPARVSIGLLTVLTTTTQSTGINASLPRVSYIKAIDVWMSVCLVFVFSALLEYALVNVLARRTGVKILHSIPRPMFGRPPPAPKPPPKESNAESQLDQVMAIFQFSYNLTLVRLFCIIS